MPELTFQQRYEASKALALEILRERYGAERATWLWEHPRALIYLERAIGHGHPLAEPERFVANLCLNSHGFIQHFS